MPVSTRWEGAGTERGILSERTNIRVVFRVGNASFRVNYVDPVFLSFRMLANQRPESFPHSELDTSTVELEQHFSSSYDPVKSNHSDRPLVRR